MDIKLKNYHKLAVVIIALVILLPSLAMMVIRPHYIKQQQGHDDLSYSYTNLMSQLVNDTYVLYTEELQGESETTLNPFDIFFPAQGIKNNASSSRNNIPQNERDSENEAEALEAAESSESEETSDTEAAQMAASDLSSKFAEWQDDFSTIRSFIEYEVLDSEEETVVDSNQALADKKPSLYSYINSMQEDSVLKSSCDYAFIAAIKYGAKGNIESTSFFSHVKDNSSQVLNEAAKENPTAYFEEQYGFKQSFQKPVNRIYCFAITKDSLAALRENRPGFIYQTEEYGDVHAADDLVVVFLTLLAVVAAAALFLPLIKQLETGNEKIFCMPFELVFLVGCIALGISVSVSADPYTMNQQAIYTVLTSVNVPAGIAMFLQYVWGLLGWVTVFALCYWAVGCLRAVFTMGPAQYIRERVIIYRIWPWLRSTCHNIYDGLLHVNLKDDATRVLIKVVLINFIILGFISLLWFWGIGALVIYSIALFFLLRKYFMKIQDQYHLLLEATNELAKGNLNGTIPEDLGIFEPFRDEIDKIQTGFKKAVDEEVKSTKMKTDLITNVSHDLKTPLTAIITYVDLLKNKNLSEEERDKYIGILDQKANRLKILIEDLFEVSKATSRSVTLNIVDVDIVSLLRQVKLELQDKIDATDLYFRWQLPEEKVILPLDSQRTYRVFENLLVNITKYAMPRTRVYIIMENTENHVKISMKNISATELTFNPNEITERFVRGDASRNTEGSGLGLAIAKSFTELQGGRLEISTNADLFTVEITFLK